MGLFRDFLPVPLVCKNFFPVRPGYSLAQGCFDAIFGSRRPFSPRCEDTSVLTVVFMRLLSLFFHPDNTVANLSRPILSRIARNNSRGTATSAIWKIICREFRVLFTDVQELAAILKERGFHPVPEIEWQSKDKMEWAKVSARQRQFLKVSKALFGPDGKLKLATQQEWQPNFITLETPK